MISNDRQLAIAQRKIEELRAAASELDPEDAEIYEELLSDLSRDADKYISVRDGQVNVFHIESIDELASAVIAARVARGWTQAELANELEVSEQMVQKDEAREYEHVGIAKLANVMDTLGYEFVGTLRPAYLPVEGWRFPSEILFGGAIGRTSAAISNISQAASAAPDVTSWAQISGIAINGISVMPYMRLSTWRNGGLSYKPTQEILPVSTSYVQTTLHNEERADAR